MKKRYCKYCGKLLVRKKLKPKAKSSQFIKKRGWRREDSGNFKKRVFCDVECRALSSKTSIVRKCKQCGKCFEVNQYRIKAGMGKYCSNRCVTRSQQRRKKCICGWCGKKFKVKLSVPGKYCCSACVARSTFTKWSKKKIEKSFKLITTNKKYGWRWLCYNHGDIANAINRHHDKPSWAKFLKSIGDLKKIGENSVYYYNPRKRKLANKLLRIFLDECDLPKHRVITESINQLLPDRGGLDGWSFSMAMKYLKEKRAVKILRRGKWWETGQAKTREELNAVSPKWLILKGKV